MANDLKTNRRELFNVPNQLTAARLLLSIVVFVLIPFEQYLPALVVFLIAASTDWIDGFYGPAVRTGHQAGPGVRSLCRQDHHLWCLYFSGSGTAVGNPCLDGGGRGGT